MKKQHAILVTLSLAGIAPLAHAESGGIDSWKPVSDETLDQARGGFDVGGLKASFGIERTVSIDGVATTVQSIQIPDISKITKDQAAQLEAATRAVFVVQNGPGNSVATGTVAATTTAPPTSGAVASNVPSSPPSALPASTAASSAPGAAPGATPTAAAPTAPSSAMGSAAAAAIPAAMTQARALAMGSAGTIVQNTLDGQSIQSVTTLSTSVNSLGTFRALDWQAGLQAALIQSR
jgi:hypothetical protein